MQLSLFHADITPPMNHPLCAPPEVTQTVENPPLAWKTKDVILPPREDQPEKELRECLSQEGLSTKVKSRAALILAYQNRCKAGRRICISALHIGDDIVAVHTPGESFIEYQLYAQELRPDAMVVVPSYGDCGPGYVTLAKSFAEGGYEPYDSFCSEKSEGILRDAIATVVRCALCVAGATTPRPKPFRSRPRLLSRRSPARFPSRR